MVEAAVCRVHVGYRGYALKLGPETLKLGPETLINSTTTVAD